MNIKVKDYFKDINKNKVNYRIDDKTTVSDYRQTPDFKKLVKLREKLNGLPTVNEQLEYLKVWRDYQVNRDLDYRLLGIPKDATVELKKENSDNNFYKAPESVIDPNLDRAEYETENANFVKNAAGLASAASSIANHLASSWKIYVGAFAVFGLVNAGLFLGGYLTSSGQTPFEVCGDTAGKTSSRHRGGSGATYDIAGIKGITKVKDGWKMPVDYMIAGEGYQGTDWDGPDQDRGIGVYASEDFLNFGGQSGDNFSRSNYAVAGRWEYIGYLVKDGMWPGHDKYGNGTDDGVDTTQSYLMKDYTEEGYAWHTKQKVLIINPENGKAVVCIIGDGQGNPNWGGSPLSAGPLGLSYLAQAALGFKVDDTLDGGDYSTNVRDSGVKLEAYFVDESTEPGVYEGDFSKLISEKAKPENKITGSKQKFNNGSKKNSNEKCNTEKLSGNGNKSIADAYVSLAHESVAIATPNTSDNNGNGTDLYVKVHDLVLGGDPWYQSCDRGAATAIRWSGADDEFPLGNCEMIIQYLESSRGKDYWQHVGDNVKLSDLKPGDVVINEGHIMIYVGNEAVRAKFPNSNGNIVHASIGDALSESQQSTATINRPPAVDEIVGEDLSPWMAGSYKVYRNIKQETNSKYKDVLKQ